MEDRGALITFLRDIEKATALLAQRLEALEKAPPMDHAEEADIPTARGPRQQELLDLLQHDLGEAGLKTRELADATGMDQPNVYLTVQGLQRQGKVEMVPGSEPQRWRLAPKFRAWSKVVKAARQVPPGRWTTYGELAVVVYGNLNAAVTIGQAAAQLRRFPNPHRVLAKGGKVPPGWLDHESNGPDECVARLTAEGVEFVDDHADPACHITAEELKDLVADSASGE